MHTKPKRSFCSLLKKFKPPSLFTNSQTNQVMKKNFKEKIKQFQKTFKAIYNEEKSTDVADIKHRETKRKIREKVAALNIAKNLDEVEEIIAQKTPRTFNAIENNKKRKEKRIKAWSDRGYRTIGPAAGATLGGAVGGIIGATTGSVLPVIGTAIGGVTGVAAGSVIGGRAIQVVAVNHGIPAHKAFKEAKKAAKAVKQEIAHKTEMEKIRQTGSLEDKLTGNKEFVNLDEARRTQKNKNEPQGKKTVPQPTPLNRPSL